MAVKWNGDAVFAEMKSQLARNMAEAVDHVADDVKASIGKPGTSAPGEPPRKDSGALQASVKSRVEVTDDKVSGIVTAGDAEADYAAELELGFVGLNESGHMIHLEPRPFLRPAMDRNRAAIARKLASEE